MEGLGVPLNCLSFEDRNAFVFIAVVRLIGGQKVEGVRCAPASLKFLGLATFAFLLPPSNLALKGCKRLVLTRKAGYMQPLRRLAGACAVRGTILSWFCRWQL